MSTTTQDTTYHRMCRELDGVICREIFGWVYVPVSPDSSGEGAGKLLAPHHNMPQEWYNTLPLKGPIPRTWFCPHFSTDLNNAIRLCILVGHNPLIAISRISSINPRELCLQALRTFHTTYTPPLVVTLEDNPATSPASIFAHMLKESIHSLKSCTIVEALTIANNIAIEHPYIKANFNPGEISVWWRSEENPNIVQRSYSLYFKGRKTQSIIVSESMPVDESKNHKPVLYWRTEF